MFPPTLHTLPQPQPWCPQTLSEMAAHDHYPFKGGGRTQTARHNLSVFEGGGPGKRQQALIFLTAFYLQDFILVGPLTLYGVSFLFLKNSGRRSKCPIAFPEFSEQKCKKMKNT